MVTQVSLLTYKMEASFCCFIINCFYKSEDPFTKHLGAIVNFCVSIREMFLFSDTCDLRDTNSLKFKFLLPAFLLGQFSLGLEFSTHTLTYYTK